MRPSGLFLVVFFLAVFMRNAQAAPVENSYDETVMALLTELSAAIETISATYDYKNRLLVLQLEEAKSNLRQSTKLSEQVLFLIVKDSLGEELKKNRQLEYSEIAKVRFIKGLQIINHLYEKTLSLDHHFASVHTLRDIHNMSNPNQYPEFVALRQQLTERKVKKTGFNLSTLLGDNIYTSVIHSMVSLFVQPNASQGAKEDQLQDIECIMDFTLQMHNDLNIIYFETAFLQNGNEDVISDLEQLFQSYTKPIGYSKSLSSCRDEDDWDTVTRHLHDYLDKLDSAIDAQKDQKSVRLQQINLQFSIDRLLQFITQYNAFIEQGEKFYEKFWVMLDSYENETICQEKIPTQYLEMKSNIKVAIAKFNTAYKPIGINGSKLKQLLYGINEYQ